MSTLVRAGTNTSNRGFSLREPTALKDLSVIAIQNAGNSDLNTVVVLQLSVSGTAMPGRYRVGRTLGL